MKKSYVFHPLLFTFYAILAPAANNIFSLGFAVIRSLVVGIVITIILVAVTRLLVKDRVKAGMIASGVIVAIYSYGHVMTLLSSFTKSSSLVFYAITMIVYLALLFAWVRWLRKTQANVSTLNNYLNLVGFILIIFPLATMIAYPRQASKIVEDGDAYRKYLWDKNSLTEIPVSGERKLKPGTDIYYIILDGYTRDDVLKDLYHYDNTAFLNELKKRGFYIAEESHSNYAETVFSMASTFNLSQINDAPDFIQNEASISGGEPFRDWASQLIRDNRVTDFLKQQDFSIVEFESHYERLKFNTVDQYMKSPKVGNATSEAMFEMILFNTTFGNVYFKLRGKDYKPMQALYDEHRERVLYNFSHLPDFANADDQSYFIYAHIVSPHPPYVFGPNGEPRTIASPYTLLDTEQNEDWTPEIYTDQVTFVNKKVLKTIDEILSKSAPKPIIILQADHSSRNFGTIERTPEDKYKLSFPILNAYYFPDENAEKIVYASITPVNTFRSIFNYYLGTSLPLLEDTSYVTGPEKPAVHFYDVCETEWTCPNP